MTTIAIPDLTEFGNVVPEGYQYYDKQISHAEDLALPGAYLKWYNLYPTDAPITPEQLAECRKFVAAEVQHLNWQGELGFVILHRAGPYLLLMVNTWRNTNEIWESVYVKSAVEAGDYQLAEYPTTHRGTFCVWELTIVWHERNAWMKFLASNHDRAAKQAYINDRYSGLT